MDIDDIRKKIDRIDRELVKLINRRAKFALDASKLKESNARGIFAPERELQVLESVFLHNKGPLVDKSIKAIYREIISACRALEKPIFVAYPGPAGSSAHIASVHQFGNSTGFVSLESIADVFGAVERKSASYGVIPIENSTEGIVDNTLERLVVSDLNIIAELVEDQNRFFVIGTGITNPSGRDKTAIVLSMPRKATFDDKMADITVIESRLIKQTPWVFIEIKGHITDEPLERAVSKLSDQSPFVRVLGSYPEAK
ncbi:MAG: chorismate mutase [Armatimonadota bacterium]